MSLRFRYWAWTGFWAALVMASVAFMLMGLWRRSQGSWEASSAGINREAIKSSQSA